MCVDNPEAAYDTTSLPPGFKEIAVAFSSTTQKKNSGLFSVPCHDVRCIVCHWPVQPTPVIKLTHMCIPGVPHR